MADTAVQSKPAASRSGRSTRLWYIVPILLGIIGGIIAWIVLRKKDPSLGKNCFIVGIVFLIIELMYLAFAWGSLGF